MSDEPRAQVLYRMFDAGGDLLYVGISMNVAQRFAAHRAEKNWWADIASIRLEHFTDRAAVSVAEVAAIQGEGPRYNVKDVAGQPLAGATLGAGPVAERLQVASANRKAIESEIRDARIEERRAIKAALGSNTTQAQICRITGFTREYIRRMTKPDATDNVDTGT